MKNEESIAKIISESKDAKDAFSLLISKNLLCLHCDEEAVFAYSAIKTLQRNKNKVFFEITRR